MRRAENLRPHVFVNVYHASGSEQAGIPGCCGAYHSGIEINGIEYAFAVNAPGVYECQRGDYGDVIEHIDLGQASISNSEISSVINQLRQSWTGNKYHVILNNCNNFSQALALACTGEGIPNWINRAAWWASWFKCCFPSTMSNEPGIQETLVPQRFAGEGMVLASEGPKLSTEEQRQARLRKLQPQ